jgi:AmmeMemoRadiSam system protein A
MIEKRLSDEDRSALLTLARSAIGKALGKAPAVQRPRTLSRDLARNRGCFVTLRQKGGLRGCVGTIEPMDPLAQGVEENALNAAFKDYRFKKLAPGEWDGVSIEISALTPPRTLEFTDWRDLLSQIEPGVHGVILSRGGRRATFLPQVWEEIAEKERFLDALCRKAGLAPSCWKDAEIQVQVYEAEHFSE